MNSSPGKSGLTGIVDRFILVEAAQTHRGVKKPLHFNENIQRFAPWRDKIEHVVLKTLPKSDDPWVRENAQRNGIALGLGEISNDDLIVVSDVDEIPRADVLSYLAATPSVRIAGLRMPLFYLRFNYLQIKGQDPVYVWGVAARGEIFRRVGAQGLRDTRRYLQRRSWKKSLTRGQAVMQHAGWHFSYLGDDDHVRLKLASFAHREHAVSETLQHYGVEGILAQNLDLFGRPGFEWVTVSVNDYFPPQLVEALERYRHLIVANSALVINTRLSLERDTLVLRQIRPKPSVSLNVPHRGD